MQPRAINCNSLLRRLFTNEYDECMIYCNNLSAPDAVEWLEAESVHLLKTAALLNKYEHTQWFTLVTPRRPAAHRADIIKLTAAADASVNVAADCAVRIFNFMLNGR